MRIKLNLGDPERLWIHPLLTPEFADAVKSIGHHIVTENPDVTVMESKQTPGDEPTIVFCHRDAAEVPADCGKHDELENILGYITPVYCPNGRSITHQNWGVFDTELPVTGLCTMVWEQMYRNGSWMTKPPPERKEYDVSFCGTISNGHVFTREHRRRMVAQWPQLQGLRQKAVFVEEWPRPLTWRQAWDVSGLSKVVVSPWGVSELSWRCYEAVLNKCVLVRPRGPGINVTCDPYRNVIWCDPDFGNLRQCVELALIRSNDLDELEANRNYVLRESTSLEVLADYLVSAIRQLVA